MMTENCDTMKAASKFPTSMNDDANKRSSNVCMIVSVWPTNKKKQVVREHEDKKCRKANKENKGVRRGLRKEKRLRNAKGKERRPRTGGSYYEASRPAAQGRYEGGTLFYVEQVWPASMYKAAESERKYH